MKPADRMLAVRFAGFDFSCFDLVVVAEIGFVGLLNGVATVLVEEDAGYSIAVVNVDEKSAKDVEAKKAGDFDAGGMAFWSEVECDGAAVGDLAAGEPVEREFYRAGDLEEGPVGGVDIGAVQIATSLFGDELDDGPGGPL